MKPDELVKHLSSLLGEGLQISMEEIANEDDSEIAKIKYGLLCLYEDLIFHKTMSDALINNLKSTLFDTSVIVITNATGKITEVNDAFLELSGFTNKELLGKRLSLLNSDYHSSDFFNEIRKVIKTGATWSGELCNKKKNKGLFWLHSYILPIKDDKGKIVEYWNVGTDINDRIRAEDELLNKERLLAESARMASLGRFVGGVAHEINNPLAIIGSKAALLKLKIEMGEADLTNLKPHLNDISDTVMRIANVIDSLRSFTDDSRPLLKTKVNLSQVVRGTMEMCAEKLRVNEIELETNIDPNIEIYCNKLHISEVLINLINNSFDAIVPQKNKWIRVDTVEEDQVIKIIVTDSGEGIDASIVGSIMHPYFTTKNLAEASGLGLSISNNIIKRYNGKLLLNCECDNTQFVVELPKKSIMWN